MALSYDFSVTYLCARRAPASSFQGLGQPVRGKLEHPQRLGRPVDGIEDEGQVEGRLRRNGKAVRGVLRGEVDGCKRAVLRPRQGVFQRISGDAPDLPRAASRGQEGESQEKEEEINSQE